MLERDSLSESTVLVEDISRGTHMYARNDEWVVGRSRYEHIDNCIGRITRCLITRSRSRCAHQLRLDYRKDRSSSGCRLGSENSSRRIVSSAARISQKPRRRSVGEYEAIGSGFSCHKDSCITQGCRAPRS